MRGRCCLRVFRALRESYFTRRALRKSKETTAIITQKHNFYVYSSAYPSVGWEFELSRHQHSKDKRLKFTVTALFKNVGNRAKQLAAWRILCASVAGRELLPKYAEDFETHLRELAAEESFSATSQCYALLAPRMQAPPFRLKPHGHV